MNNFKQCLLDGNVVEFHTTFSEKLDRLLRRRLIEMNYICDNESEAVSKIQAVARSFTGGQVDHDSGVLAVTLSKRQAANDFAAWLEDCMFVDNYEMTLIQHSPQDGVSYKDEIEFDDIVDDDRFEYEFTINLDPDIVDYNDIDFDEMMDEVTRKIKVNAAGVKTIKMKCQRGFKWNSVINVCEKISGDMLARIRKGARKAIRTKKAEGKTLQTRINRKTKKAMRFRHQLGLS